MTTLIAVYNSEGCVGRCDGRCYDAKHEKCTCICGGKNHGKGKAQAVANTQELAESWVERAAEKSGSGLQTTITNEALQGSLF